VAFHEAYHRIYRRLAFLDHVRVAVAVREVLENEPLDRSVGAGLGQISEPVLQPLAPLDQVGLEKRLQVVLRFPLQALPVGETVTARAAVGVVESGAVPPTLIVQGRLLGEEAEVRVEHGGAVYVAGERTVL